MVSKSFSSLCLTLGIAAPLLGATASTACSSKFEGCEASRTCGTGGEGGEGANGGKGGSSGRGNGTGGRSSSGGQGGALAMGGDAGDEGTSAGKGGTAGGAGTTGVAGKGGSAGTNTEPMAGEGGTEADPEPDVTPPYIVSVSPIEGATGVLADAVITITFSEPMDRGTAEDAYQSADIPRAQTTIRWSSDDTVVTITPNAPLAYKAGARNDLTFLGTQYAIEMTDTAEDKAGNRLIPKSWSFATLRRIEQILVADGADIRWLHDGVNEPCTNALYLGDNDENGTLGGFVQFDLTDLVEGVTVFESAQLYGERIAGAGSPRDLDAVHVRELDADITMADGSTPVGEDLGVFLEYIVDNPHLDVLPAMTSDYAADNLVQFRLQMEPASTDDDDTDDYWRVLCSLDLGLLYLAP